MNLSMIVYYKWEDKEMKKAEFWQKTFYYSGDMIEATDGEVYEKKELTFWFNSVEKATKSAWFNEEHTEELEEFVFTHPHLIL